VYLRHVIHVTAHTSGLHHALVRGTRPRSKVPNPSISTVAIFRRKTGTAPVARMVA